MILNSLLKLLFGRIILRFPVLVILLLLAAFVPLAYNSKNFRLDTSADNLVLEDDEDLRYSRLIDERYTNQKFLVITFTPQTDLFDSANLEVIESLSNDLKALEEVSSVTSILDVPLLQSPPLKLSELTSELPNLCSDGVDMELAKKEFRDSPFYQGLLLSRDGKVTAILVHFPDDPKFVGLKEKRNELKRKKEAGTLTSEEQISLKDIERCYDEYRAVKTKENHETIVKLRAVLSKYKSRGELFLGGIAMIADDMITFIKEDLRVFGTGVLLFLILALGVIFRRFRWVILPMVCCLVSVVCMMGLLGMFGWEVTVVSSNFISLQLIMTLALVIHLIVRYRELEFTEPLQPKESIVLETIMSRFSPCLFAVLTTIAGFTSLIFCRILPVINFGWMMIGGLTISFIITFLLFPSILVFFPKEKSIAKKKATFTFTSILAKFTDGNKTIIIGITLLVFILSFVGIAKLRVENSFIKYFKKDSEIYQGLDLIDRKLGGTTPLDVIIDFNNIESVSGETASHDEEFDEFDEFELEEDKDKYWFTADKIASIKEVHNYLQELDETGKVLSLSSIINIAEQLNDGRALDSFELALLNNETPDEFRELLLWPYVSVENNQARFWVRIKDSQEELRRDKLLKTIQSDMVEKLGFDKDNVRLTGVLVLYNNMLQSLFDSQIKTFGITAGILLIMFFVLFRSIKIAVIAMIPNVLPVAVVLGIMGWADIPLDMMTITIAAIGIGIAVDDTIHYVHRFREEIKVDHDYVKTMYRCHGSIGFAMYYTTITVVIGFSILALSNFIPNIYFGLLTAAAMLTALIADLTLLPVLLIVIKPFGKKC